jgi:hypothetical protein
MRLAPESPLPMLESVRLGDEPHSMTASSALAGTGRPEPNSATYVRVFRPLPVPGRTRFQCRRKRQ